MEHLLRKGSLAMEDHTSLDPPGKKLLLLADDDAISLRLLSRHLREMGDILLCSDGVSALRETLRKLPDLLLLDVGMPKMNGYEVCRKVKSHSANPQHTGYLYHRHGRRKGGNRGFCGGSGGFRGQTLQARVLRARAGAHLELKTLRDNLESQVRKRTRELQETQMEILHRLAMAAEYRIPMREPTSAECGR